MALFEIRNLTFTYPDQKKPALTDLNFSLKQGEFLVVCGKSGCGKSTLAKLVSGLCQPWEGTVSHLTGNGKDRSCLKAGSWTRCRCGSRGRGSAMCSRVRTTSW